MDEIGAEQLAKLSCNATNKIETSAIFDSTNTSENVVKSVVDKSIVGKGIGEKLNSQEANGSKDTVQRDTLHVSGNIVAEHLVDGSSGIGAGAAAFVATVEDDLDEKEKADATPENLKKIDDVICANYGNEISQTGDELKIVEDESPSKQCLSFTIDFREGESATSAAAAAKYKNIMERFQNRHRRGASLSKLEDQKTLTTPVVTPKTPRTPRVTTAQSRQSRIEGSDVNKVKLRIRERSTSGIRDSSKRHSWSPRSSTQEVFQPPKVSEKLIKQAPSVGIVKECRAAIASDTLKTTLEATAPVQVAHKNRIQYPNRNEQSSNFTPRSTAMQMALNKFEFACSEPPLEHTKNEDVEDSVSEAGTYTLDGDNYTEEQKELMNIDKATRSALQLQRNTNIIRDLGQMRPNDLPLLSATSENRRRNNVLEISYYHDSTNLKPKVSYLEKIKSRVKNTKSPDKKINSPTDTGTFTSVTTSGILSKKLTLDPHPRLNRRNSLTKSQIDSSEYVSMEGSLRANVITCPSTYTDHQKAEYKLNLFTNQAEYTVESNSTPNSPNHGYSKSRTPETGLKSAQSKNDWIQEWARNARARSISTKDFNSQMSRSYDCEVAETTFSDSTNYRNKHIEKLHRIGDVEYSSDTNISSCKTHSNSALVVNSSRPPLSPSRIPSPMHSVGRARGASRTRGSLQDLSPLNSRGPETDIYLQKTAAAISNLAQSLSRKDSLQSCKSPPSTRDSPRRQYQQQPYSADEYSPPHTGRTGIHKRNLSLDYRTNAMSQSLNNETLNALLDYHNKQRSRQNSFDAAMNSPNRRSRQAFIDQTQSSIKQAASRSPLKRSSSFSVKPLTANMIQKNTTTNRNVQKFIPTTKNSVPVAKNSIQKSASSTSFRKLYSDYDDNIAYYINDEDDLVDDYCSSEEYEVREFYTEQELEPEIEPEPLTNTRYNKALLMRIERSKQKVAGMAQAKPTSAGVMACPNTPEMPRRTTQSAARSSMRQSVPRDSSLNRLRGEIPNTLASAKKQLLQTATTVGTNKRVQPKYLDISKYKPTQGASFLRKNESKSTLVVAKAEVKRSPSSASVALNRADPIRASNRSIKSAGSRPTSSKRDSSVTKQKETELAMWKRRATYDPMKAAAEGRRKQEEAKKVVQVPTKSTESSVVLRSQSFHSGVGALSGNRTISRAGVGAGGGSGGGDGGIFSGSTATTDGSDQSYRWTLSTDSSDEDEDGIYAATNS